MSKINEPIYTLDLCFFESQLILILFLFQTIKMFTGLTNQIGSWMGTKKPAEQSQDASPQQPEAPSTTEAPPASTPG